jgi:hypothetical protein
LCGDGRALSSREKAAAVGRNFRSTSTEEETLRKRRDRLRFISASKDTERKREGRGERGSDRVGCKICVCVERAKEEERERRERERGGNCVVVPFLEHRESRRKREREREGREICRRNRLR